MAKIFYTDREIEDLAKQGVDSIEINENVVLTDLAVDKARRLGIKLEKKGESRGQEKARNSAPAIKQNLSPSGPDGSLEARVYKAVKSKLGDQVDETLLRTIVKRVVQNIGNTKIK